MGKNSSIQWCDGTWNPARGCDKISPGCKFCYMMRDSHKFGWDGYAVKRTKTVFNMPLKYKETKSKMWDGKPLIFTSSLTDIFHKDIDSFRNEIWDIIRRCPHLIFQILTKRPDRVNEHLPTDWCEGWDNVWLGTSVENDDYNHRIVDLCNIKAKTRFISAEPLLASTKLLLTDDRIKGKVHQVIIGGESGNDNGKYLYRPCELEWIEQIMTECKNTNTPIFVKQLGTHLAKKLKLNDRHGGDISEWPKLLQIREFPSY